MKLKFPLTVSFLVPILVAFLLAFPGVRLSAQVGWLPGIYFGIPNDDKEHLFFDEFDNNDQKWNLESQYLEMSIKDGDFHCQSKNSRPYVKRRFVHINQQGNYEIEVSLRFISGEDDSPMGLTFGRDVHGNEYNFFVTADGSYRIFKYQKQAVKTYVDWTRSPLLSLPHSYNTLTVRKVEGNWIFFLNREKVFQTEAEPLFGYDVGFSIGGNMELEVDYLRVSELKSHDNLGPIISIIEPVLDEQGRAILSSDRQVIRGRVHDAGGVAQLTINEHTIIPESNGEFSANVRLPEGSTRIKVEAVDNFLNISSFAFSMEYRPTPLPSAMAANPGFSGKNYLLTIGVNDYTNWGSLHNAIRDCQDISRVLVSEYQFEEAYTIRLFNEQASRENILETLEMLQDKITENDNLLIYYAGHGYYDADSKRGYWVPVNARQNKIVDYIRNSTVHDYLSSIHSHNTLLIVDACYAGSLFSRSRSVLSEMAPSRWAFTSGDIEKVWDGQPGENSPFAKYLIQYLHQNRKSKLRADELISSVKTSVSRNTEQNPMGSPLQNVGDEGGVFIFYRK